MINPDFNKDPNGLIPAIVQDVQTRKVLMLGYMNAAALAATESSGKVTFFSRSKNRLWTKGEESGHFLNLVSIKNDCDNDSLLIQVTPQGPTCHKGTDSCWGETNSESFGFLTALEKVISDRRENAADQSSYVAELFEKGLNKIAQKVGEEGVEVALAAVAETKEDLLGECADLFYHTLVLLQDQNIELSEVMAVLQSRHQAQ